MTNVSATPEKIANRRSLIAFAEKALEKQGWTVSRAARDGKSSVRHIGKNGAEHKISIRTSQDSWFAFPPKKKGPGFLTLDEVDHVVVASLDDRHNPRWVRVHMIPGDVARDAFNRARKAKEAAGHVVQLGRGIWLSLYEKEAASPVSLVGAGLGLKYPPIAELDLRKEVLPSAGTQDDDFVADAAPTQSHVASVQHLTIGEAKRLLSVSLGVPESAIKITVEH